MNADERLFANPIMSQSKRGELVEGNAMETLLQARHKSKSIVSKARATKAPVNPQEGTNSKRCSMIVPYTVEEDSINLSIPIE